MISLLRRWLHSFNCSRARGNSHTTTRPLEVQHLEDRSLPSVALDPSGLQSGVPLCSCMMCGGGTGPSVVSQATDVAVPGDPYAFSNGTNNPSGAFRWSQPGGQGSVITITYSFHSSVVGGLNGVSYKDLRWAVQEALGRWAAVAPLQFIEVADSGPSFLEGTNYSSDGMPMIRIGARAQDGQYGTLGYAYYPTAGLGGDVVLDSSEAWSNRPGSGRIDVTEVLVHELGHALGLGHESTNSAIMNPTYGGRYSGPGSSYLLQDDINGIRVLYGAGTGGITPLGGLDGTPPGAAPPTPPPTTGPAPTIIVSGGRMTVTGSTGNDTFVLHAGVSAHLITVNGHQYGVNPATITQIVFAGGSGTDSIQFIGTNGTEQVNQTTAALSVLGNRLNLSASSFESSLVYGNGGEDSLTFTDTSGNDSISLGRGYSALVSTGLNWQFHDFRYVTARSTTAGLDSATFSAGAGNDIFDGSNTSSVLRSGDYYLTALAFERVIVRGGQGGYDSATLIDSTGRDTLASSNGIANLLYANGSQIQMVSYGPTYAHSINGGADEAWLYGTTGNDTLYANPAYSVLSTSFGVVGAIGFGTTYVYGSGGADTGYLTGSTGDDRLFDTLSYSRLETQGRMIHVNNFLRLEVNGQGGNDSASLADSTGNDVLTQNGNQITFQRAVGVTTVVTAFRSGTVHASTGGNDLLYIYGSANNDVFTTDGVTGSLAMGLTNWTFSGFDLVHLLAAGGNDTVERRTAANYQVLNPGNWVG